MQNCILPSDTGDNKYVLNYCFDELKDYSENNIIDFNNEEQIFILHNFQYYQHHEFHKLSQNPVLEITFDLAVLFKFQRFQIIK